MMLTHTCPECKKEHQDNTTPEPDKLCPTCDAKQKGYVDGWMPVRINLLNNVFCKELCVICREVFDADLTLYEIKAGYICSSCVGHLNIKVEATDETIIEVQKQFYGELR